jgi:hypothetical protein
MCPENENPLDNTKRIYIEDTSQNTYNSNINRNKSQRIRYIFIEKYTSLTS